MFRYVAFVWDDAESSQREAAQRLSQKLVSITGDWRSCLRTAGLAVFCTGTRPPSLEAHALGREGVVVGTLFEKSAEGSRLIPGALAAEESKAILASAGHRLIDRYWGRYVAFLRDAATDATYVLRDPTATLPCLTFQSSGVDIYVSSMEDAVDLSTADFSVDWDYLRALMCFSVLQLPITGLQGVSQILGGECAMRRGRERRRAFYWNMLHVAETAVLDNPAEAANALRRAAHDCIAAWASAYQGIAHTLSGGLDSSIVLACLQDTPHRDRVTCINFHSPGADTDERRYAELAARRAGCELVERPRRTDVSLEPLYGVHRTGAPVNYWFYLDNHYDSVAFAREQGAQAVFSGAVGDQLFYQYRARFAAGDYMLRRGIRPALFHVALDAARMDRISVWQVLRQGFAEAVLGRRWKMSHEAAVFKELLNPEIVAAVKRDERFQHPIFRAPGRVPSGKLWHAASMLFAPEFLSPIARADDPDSVAPINSQPLIEVALRIPTYVLTRGGWDRAVARRAFQHEIPREIAIRRTKGGMEEHVKAIFLRNLSLVRELLMEGFLVRERILDKKKLHEVLSGEATRIASGRVELFDYLSAEAWLRRWHEPKRRAAA